MTDSLFRKHTKILLRKISLTGRVVDLGGCRDADYHRFMVKNGEVTIVNLDSKTKPDLVCNLEEPLPLETGSFNAVLLINVLEHIYHYERVLKEAARIIRAGGEVVAVVPFLHPIHAAPNDYFRYSKSALKRLFIDNGFHLVMVTEIGGGVNLALVNLINRFLPAPLMVLIEYLAQIIDHLFLFLTRCLGKNYRGNEYPLGYLIHARR